MSSAGFILAITFSVSGIFALIFSFIASYDTAYRSARWFSLAYLLGMLSTLFEFILPLVPDGRMFVVVGIFSSFLAALMVGVIGVAHRYEVKPPLRLLAAIFIVSVAANFYIYGLPRDSVTRLFLYQAPYFITQLTGAVMIFRYAVRHRLDRLDRIAGVFLVLSALNYLAKPFMAWSLGGPGARPQDYLGSVYALFSQTMGAVLVASLGALFVMLYVRDMLADIRFESETDRLSGLLNRRGFEQRVKEHLADADALQGRACLVLCDLDHFKQLNDDYGHATGDRAIETFAGLLRNFASPGFAIGRIGGEEFAVFLPRGNRSAARLFAESVRSAYANSVIEGASKLRRFTASFGVAELVPDEDFASLLRRADMALYEAKRGGRNRVSLSPAAQLPDSLSPEARRRFRDVS